MSIWFGGEWVAVTPGCLEAETEEDERGLWSVPRNALQALDEGADSASIRAAFAAGIQ